MRRAALPRPVVIGTVAASSAVLAACSLTSFVDLDVRTCGAGSSPLECNEQICGELNAAHELDVSSACEVYQYAEGGGCTLETRDWDGDSFVPAGCASETSTADCDDEDPSVNADATESCDGRDENCNGIIDDGAFVATSAPERLSDARAERAFDVRYATDGSPYALLFSSAQTGAIGTVSRVDLRAGLAASVEPVYFAESRLDVPVDEELEPGCPALSGDAPETCIFADMAIAGADERQLSAAIDVSGCARGERLRVGYLDGEAFVQRGPEARSNVFRGVDLTEGLSCDASGAEVARGGTRPSIAISERRVGQAYAGLAAWIAAPADATTLERCGQERNVEVHALGLWLEQDKAEEERRWVNASDDGTPRVLGRTTQGFAPTLLALPGDETSTRFLVLFRDAATRRLAARRVSVPKSPAFVKTAPDVARDTPAVQIGEPFDVPGSEAADAASAVLGPERTTGVCGGAGVEIGITFRTGCGSASARHHFTSLGVRANGTWCVAKPVVTLGKVDDRWQVPPASASYVASGFVSPGFEHGGQRADASATGGYLVAWTEGTATSPRVVVGRVLDLDASLLDTFTLAEEADSPFLYAAADGSPHVAYRDARRSALSTRPLGCGR